MSVMENYIRRTEKLAIALKALKEIACFSDKGANDYLEKLDQ